MKPQLRLNILNTLKFMMQHYVCLFWDQWITTFLLTHFDKWKYFLNGEIIFGIFLSSFVWISSWMKIFKSGYTYRMDFWIYSASFAGIAVFFVKTEPFFVQTHQVLSPVRMLGRHLNIHSIVYKQDYGTFPSWLKAIKIVSINAIYITFIKK